MATGYKQANVINCCLLQISDECRSWEQMMRIVAHHLQIEFSEMELFHNHLSSLTEGPTDEETAGDKAINDLLNQFNECIDDALNALKDQASE